ncbi:hypothetical protein BpHYR1_015909 [Brachionus plicatilis]|uniref:Uncharacterized protein n=1 Tax=Brachionus plicatilis TaxID=10195 RepID=A0A3M7QGA2_BRAPC|nr:hypothetical protein BpHYR1_015909 [Brachionus plicatilis]
MGPADSRLKVEYLMAQLKGLNKTFHSPESYFLNGLYFWLNRRQRFSEGESIKTFAFDLTRNIAPEIKQTPVGLTVPLQGSLPDLSPMALPVLGHQFPRNIRNYFDFSRHQKIVNQNFTSRNMHWHVSRIVKKNDSSGRYLLYSTRYSFWSFEFTILLKKEKGVLIIIFYLKLKKIFETSHFFNYVNNYNCRVGGVMVRSAALKKCSKQKLDGSNPPGGIRTIELEWEVCG